MLLHLTHLRRQSPRPFCANQDFIGRRPAAAAIVRYIDRLKNRVALADGSHWLARVLHFASMRLSACAADGASPEDRRRPRRQAPANPCRCHETRARAPARSAGSKPISFRLGAMAISYRLAAPTLSLEARENAFKDVDGLGLVALLQVEVEFEPLLLLADHRSCLGEVVVEPRTL